MSTDGLATVSLVAATVSMGLSAGVIALYGHTIMPGLRRTDPYAFVGAFAALAWAFVLHGRATA